MSAAAELWYQIGFIRWPLGFSFFAVLALSGLSGIKLLESQVGGALRTKAWIDAVLFWGAFAAIAGVLGTLLGIIVSAQSIEAAGAVSHHTGLGRGEDRHAQFGGGHGHLRDGVPILVRATASLEIPGGGYGGGPLVGRGVRVDRRNGRSTPLGSVG